MFNCSLKRDAVLAIAFALLTVCLFFVPTGFGDRVDKDAVRARATVLEVENSDVREIGMVIVGEQLVELEIAEGELAGQRFSTVNPLLGQMDRDKIFRAGDEALAVITRDARGEIENVVPYEHYRIGLELLLLGMFALLLLVFGGWTGLKAMLSFVFAGAVLWKLLVPLLLKGADPVWLTLGVVGVLCAAIIFLVAGPTKKGVVAFSGAFLGVLSSCLLAVYFVDKLHVHGAVMPFASTLLYSGFEHLDLTKIYVAAVFLAASGAVMDLAMDVSASMAEVVEKKPDISRMEALFSGIRVGRAVVGTMTTTLLLAYSGGYVTLLMAFMAQGVLLTNTFNLIYVAAEVLKTLVGSFGLVLVAPFTAVVGSLVFTRARAGEEPRTSAAATYARDSR